MQEPSGSLVFGEGGQEERWRQSWPLRGGTYRAVLARTTQQPSLVIAESEDFTVIDYALMIDDAGNDIRKLIEAERGLGPKFCTFEQIVTSLAKMSLQQEHCHSPTHVF